MLMTLMHDSNLKNSLTNLKRFWINRTSKSNLCLDFLDIKIKNSKGRYEFDVYRKQVLMNVQIKPHSCIPSSKFTSIFKAFLAKATKICSEKCLRAEIEYLADTFCENGYNRKIKTN